MKKYRVIITEAVEHAIEIEAETSREAIEIASGKFNNDGKEFTAINWETTDIEAFEVK